MAEAKDDYSGGDKVDVSDLNQLAKNANDAGGFRDDKLAGETINGATLPVPVYQNTTDNEFYACDADDTDKLNFVGFAISDSTDGNPIDIQFNGIVKGFSGLDEGEKYYVQDAVGTIGKTPGNIPVLVGIALSETEILIMKETSYNSGVTTKDSSDVSGTQNIAHGLGKIPKKIKITAVLQSSNNTVAQVLEAKTVYNRKSQSSVSHYYAGANSTTTATTFTLGANASSGGGQTGVITVDKTNIIITWTKSGSPTGTYILLWEAEA